MLPYLLLLLVARPTVGCQEDIMQKTLPPFAGVPISRMTPALLHAQLNTTHRLGLLDGHNQYEFWTYDDSVPGPLLRARVGDTMEMTLANFGDARHGVDFHAAHGPGGGEPILQTAPQGTTTAKFHLMYPGLYVYHCGTPPVPMHIANGMYGLILVEPADPPLPKVDREFYLMKSEFYTEEPLGGMLNFSMPNGLHESPTYVVWNGNTQALLNEPLRAKTGERIRVYVGNAGPNQVLSFHIIGVVFDRVYREGDLVSPPARFVQSTTIPVGGAAAVEFQVLVPGNYTIVDHSIFRVAKGASGVLMVEGDPRPDLYCKQSPEGNCSGNATAISGPSVLKKTPHDGIDFH